MVLVYVMIALVGAAVSVFALQNLDPVVIRFLLWKADGTPLALVMLLCIAAGAFLASLIGVVQSVSQGARIRQLERRLAQGAEPVQPPARPETPR